MRTRWTTEEMENILIQLNNRLYPFKKYTFSCDKSGIKKLGSGGYADVYEMIKNDATEEKYAVKVIGFGDKHVDSEEFRDSVHIQKQLSFLENDIVKIYDCVELRVYLDKLCNVINVEKVTIFEEEAPEGDYLTLQFILMERLVPVLTFDKAGKPVLYPEELARYDENEIMKFAHDIGGALERAHKDKLLHRDVKLENVFYDPKKKAYKLGDFGIATMTENGLASTAAFTRGYGAPEVVAAIGDIYDSTADIYSYGMVIYLLLNELKFPGSENYNVNVKLQYSKGYEFEKPKHKDYKICNLLDGMCRYNPDMRYQSMEKVMNDIEGLVIGEEVRQKKEGIKSIFVAGVVFLIFGVFMCMLSSMPGLKKQIEQYKWLNVLLLSFSFFLFVRYAVMTKRSIKTRKKYYMYNGSWSQVIIFYGLAMVYGFIVQYMNVPYILEIKVYRIGVEIAKEYDCFKIGLGGVVLSLGMLIRERVLVAYREKE